MNPSKPLHPDFHYLLDFKGQDLIDLFHDLRAFILDIYPECNELLYHTHALVTGFSISEKLSDTYCVIPIYTNHLNLGFNMGTRLKDPHNLLVGTGNLMRHIPIRKKEDYRNQEVRTLVKEAIDFAIKDMEKPSKSFGKTISKIKK